MSERKSLSYLIEAEMDKATVLMASKGVTDRLQQMAEQVAMMVAKDVMPLGDTMRDVFGVEAAKAFQAAISEKLNSLVANIGDVKDSINDQIDALENGGAVSDLDTAESTDDLFGDDENAPGADMEAGDEDFAADVGVEERGKKDEDDLSDLDDVFADAPSGGMGRGMKEGAQPRKRPTSGDNRVAREFASLMREGKDVGRAARMIAETYGIDLSTVAQIISKVNKAK
jgi:hypothetical protein